MASRDPLIRPKIAHGRPADRIASGIAGLGLVGSVVATMWFFAGFYETDPGWSPASSALLLSLGLGAFAIIPCSVVMRLCRTAWRDGFRPAQGVWTLILMMPWIALAVLAWRSDWLPHWLSVGPLIIALPLCLWALVSLWLERSAPATR